MYKILNLKYFLFLFILLSSCVSLKTQKNISIDHFNLGNEYMELEKYPKAIEFYLKSLEYSSNSIETILNLIISYQLNKEYDKVEKQIIKYYKKDKSNENKKLLLLLGNNFFLQGKYNQAIKTYEEYINSYPTDVNVYFNIGLSYLKLSDKKNSLSYFLLAAEKSNNTHIPSLYNIADFYYNDNDIENSFYYFSLLEKLDKKNPDIFYRLGTIEYQTEEYEAAKNHFEQAIKLDSKNKDYYVEIAKVYSKGFKNRDKTLEHLKNAFENGFNNIKYLNSISEFKLLYEFDEYKILLKKYNLR